MIEIHDPKDPRIGVFLNQKDAWLRAAHNPRASEMGADPDDHGFFMGEGVLVVEHLIDSRFPVESVLVSARRVAGVDEVLARIPGSIPVYVAEQAVMDEIVGFPIHRGLLACGRRLPEPDPIELARDCRALVVLEDLSNHDNVGSVFRSAAALGGAGVGVWLSRRCCDPLYRKALRVSMGHALRLPFAFVDDLGAGLASLEGLGFTTIALTPGTGSTTIDESLVAGVEKPALCLGAEGPGLSERTTRACAQRVRIPISSEADSLNIAVACAIAMHRYLDPR